MVLPRLVVLVSVVALFLCLVEERFRRRPVWRRAPIVVLAATGRRASTERDRS